MTVSIEIKKRKRKAKIICYRTFEPGSIILVLRKDTKNKDFMNLVFLIDLWKVGLKDLYVNKDALNGLFRKLILLNKPISYLRIVIDRSIRAVNCKTKSWSSRLLNLLVL